MPAGDRPRALAVISDLPWPPRSGNHWRYLQNLRLLESLGYDVGVVAGRVRRDVPDPGVGEHGRLLKVVAVEPPGVDIRARVRRASGLSRSMIVGTPRNPWAQQHQAAGFDEAVQRACREFRPQAILLRSTFSHMVARVRPGVETIVLDAHDSDAIFARMLENAAPRWRRPVLRLRRLNAVRAERSFEDADEVWVPARRELEYFRRQHEHLPCLLVPNGVPVPDAPPVRDPDGRTLLLYGAFGLPMNLAAADVLMERVLPGVLAARPDCRVVLLGTGLPESRLAAWRHLPVEWLGRVDDLEPHLRRAQAIVFAPPPIFGSGTPLKVSEALAAAIPVVTTPVIGAELGLLSGESAIVDEDHDCLTKAVVRLLSEREFALAIGQAGHARARECLSFDSVLTRTQASSILAPGEQAASRPR